MRQFLAIFALAASPVASAPFLAQPIDCELGETCYLQNYVDHDASANYSDFTCGSLSYDGHKGTDFALHSLAAMQAGVNVLVAADGIVTGLRDGMVDRVITNDTVDQLQGRDCGNGVVVDHGDGWVTQYCHMKQGSIIVRDGQTVAKGTPIGQVGLSGRTQFPHLHISLRHNGKIVDPFQPSNLGTCGEEEVSLWTDPIAYSAGGLIRSGFEIGVPEYDAVKSGDAGRMEISTTDPALVIFGFGYGSRAGDVMEMSITGPSGTVISQSITLEKPQAQYFRAVGKRTPSGGWDSGTYTGIVRLVRGDQILDETKSTALVK